MAAPKLGKKDLSKLIKLMRDLPKKSNTDIILMGKLCELRKVAAAV